MKLPSSAIRVRHNIEVAHRLSLLSGKCENIHGHSMWVELEIQGQTDERGLLYGLDFGDVKRRFRGMLDRDFDHRLLLNHADPLVGLDLPGMRACAGDPTAENVARWVAEWAFTEFGGLSVRVDVHETHSNAAVHRLTDPS